MLNKNQGLVSVVLYKKKKTARQKALKTLISLLVVYICGNNYPFPPLLYLDFYVWT